MFIIDDPKRFRAKDKTVKEFHFEVNSTYLEDQLRSYFYLKSRSAKKTETIRIAFRTLGLELKVLLREMARFKWEDFAQLTTVFTD